MRESSGECLRGKARRNCVFTCHAQSSMRRAYVESFHNHLCHLGDSCVVHGAPSSRPIQHMPHVRQSQSYYILSSLMHGLIKKGVTGLAGAILLKSRQRGRDGASRRAPLHAREELAFSTEGIPFRLFGPAEYFY
eukprot:scaffold15051_cov32-Tisochrysis_lutea.AAC.3